MIRVDAISKKFKLYRAPADRLKEILFRKKCHKDFWALDNVSFTVDDGQAMGIIGQNGSGKSTMLKILTGIYLPDSGSISINGKITGLLELGTGFNPEMTGVENIYMNGLLLGMSREEIDGKKDAIIEFTELGEFIYEPIKTYSSGMTMRLAFSIAIHADPQCFVVDEALSVGDAHFQQKCMDRIRAFRKNGGSIIFVSHDLNAVKMLCDKAILLNHGIVIEEGDPENVVNSYNFLISKQGDDLDSSIYKIDGESSFGTFEAQITDIELIGEHSRSNMISSGEKATISVSIEACNAIRDVTVGIAIRDKFGQEIFGTNTYHHKKNFNLEKGKKYICRYLMEMNIAPGKYTLTAALHVGDSHLNHCIHWKDKFIDFEVAGIYGNMFIGVCRLKPEISVEVRNS